MSGAILVAFSGAWRGKRDNRSWKARTASSSHCGGYPIKKAPKFGHCPKLQTAALLCPRIHKIPYIYNIIFLNIVAFQISCDIYMYILLVYVVNFNG